MLCSKCQAENPDQAKFCAKCGQSLSGTVASTLSPTPAEFKKPLPGIEELFRNSWKLYQQAQPNLLLISLITVAAWAIWKITVIPPILSTFGLGAIASGNLSSAVSIGLVGLALLILTWIVFFEIGFWGSAAGIVALNSAGNEKKMTLADIYNEAKISLWPLSIASLLVFIIVTLGFIFLIIPGFLLAFLLSFVNFVIVCEKKSGLSAVERSMRLVWDNFLGMFGRVLLIFLAVGLVNIIFGSILLFNLLSQIIILPFVLTYYYLLYKSVAENN